MIWKTKIKPKRRHDEADLQCRLMADLDWLLPQDAFAFAVPNGGTRNIIEAVNLKRQGVKAGVPDIIIVHRGKALGLELKSKNGSLQDSQKATFPKMRAAGMRIEVARSLGEAFDLIREMGITLKSKENTQLAVRDIFRDARKGAA